MHPFRAALALTVLVTCASIPTRADDWPQFRGPAGTGVCTEKDLPTEWDGKTGKNVLWKTELPKSQNPYSSPIVVKDRILVTVSRHQPAPEHEVHCFSTADGRLLWKTSIPPGPWRDAKNTGYPTPACDGERVYVAFGTAVVAALDLEGKVVWKHELDRHDFDVAMGSSPIVWKDLVVLLCDQKDKKSHLLAFDRASGKVQYDVARPEMGFAHSTPVVATVDGRDVLLAMVSKGLQGIDPATGKPLWLCAGSGDTASPAIAGKLVYADGGRGAGGVCIELPAVAEPGPAAAKLEPKWKGDKLNEALGSPVIVDDLLYRLLGGGRLRCFRLATGEEVYAEELPNATAWTSPIATPDGRIYFASGGVSYIIRAGPKFEIIARNDLADANHATPAIANGRIYIRGTKYLWCIGQ